MKGKARREFEELLHYLAVIGVIAFFAWLVVGAMGLVSGYLEVARDPAIRFMTAILVLMMPSVVYPDIRQLRYRGMAPEERFGFADRDEG